MNENHFRACSVIRANDVIDKHEKHEGSIDPCFRAFVRAPTETTDSSVYAHPSLSRIGDHDG